MKKTQSPALPDGFDMLIEDHKNSSHLYEDHDAARRDVLRRWAELSAEGVLAYTARAAAMYNVPFERFEKKAREIVGDRPLPAGEEAIFRIHMEYQRAMWDSDLPAFPSHDSLPENDPHRDAMQAIDGVLTVKFYRLFDEYLGSKQPFPDADGQMRRWAILSAEGKVQHVARLAAIFDVPYFRFAFAAMLAIDGRTLRTDEHACLRLYYDYARQARDPSPQPLPLAPDATQRHGHQDDLRQALFGETTPRPQIERAGDRQHKR